MATKTTTIQIYGQSFRVFQGRQTRQVYGITGKKLKPAAWFWEPVDYDGDVAYSTAHSSRTAAINDAKKHAGSP